MTYRFRLLPFAVLGSIILAACGGNDPEPQTPTSASVTPTTAPTDAAQIPQAAAAPPAVTPDNCADPTACADLGAKLLQSGDAQGAKTALTKSCTGAITSITGCALLAGALASDTSADPQVVATAAMKGCETDGVTDDNRAARGGACVIYATALRDGKGADKDMSRAAHAFDDACTLGNNAGCDGKRDLAAKADAASGVPGANMTIGSATINGTTVQQIACRTEGGMGLGGLFGSMAIGKPFADKKRALDACVKGGPKQTRVRWDTVNGHMANVKVISGDDASNKCVERTLSGAQSTAPGTCAASVTLGK